MATEIKNLPDFIRAAQSEFYEQNKDVLERWYRFLGIKIDKLKHDELNEAGYIDKWMKR